MIEFLTSTIALGVGLLLGGIFFGGLWWTVKTALTSQRPALLFLSSLVLRTCIVLGGFYFVARSDWKMLLVSTIGFIAARIIVNRLVREPPKSTHVDQGASYAS